MAEPIKIEGLKEFTKRIKDLDSSLPKALRIAFNDAADVIVSDARPRIPKRSGRAARSVRARSTRTAVRVTGGGARAPYYPFLDFGGRVGKNKSVRRPFLKEGRYIYRSYFKKRDSGEFQDILSRALIKVAEDAGFEVT